MLTATAVRNARPGDKPQKLYDEKGLFLLITPAGGKCWRFKYRHGGKEKLLALGTWPAVSLAQAREARDVARALLAEGRDPADARKADKLARRRADEHSFEAVAREWHGRQAAQWSASHAGGVLRQLESNAFPALGHRPLAEIEPPELLACARMIEARGAHDLAHRVLAVCGQVFRYGVATGRCARDPTADLRGALTPHKARHQPAVRPEDLPELLRRVEGYDREAGGDTLTRMALQLMALTFVRTSELIGARWEEFDPDAGLWAIPAARMKMRAEHLVPLSRQALERLAALRPVGGGSAFLFPGRHRDKPMSNNTMLFALYRLGYKGRMTGHGFRAVASTVLNEAGFRADVIERQLAHCERDAVRGAYNRAEYLPERRELMQWWADYLDRAGGGAAVVPIRGRAA